MVYGWINIDTLDHFIHAILSHIESGTLLRIWWTRHAVTNLIDREDRTLHIYYWSSMWTVSEEIFFYYLLQGKNCYFETNILSHICKYLYQDIWFCIWLYHGSYKWIIMLEKCGRPDSNGFQLKVWHQWQLRKSKSW